MAFESPIQQALQYYPITLALVVMCVGVFALQLFFGVNPTNPTNQALIAWGANFLPFSLGEAPWRLVTSLFLHIGFMHLLFNMFALYYFGQVAERMFGAVNFLALFLLSGVGGNLLNNYLGLHSVMAGEPPIISAGASGGIMGIGMALLVTALTKTSFNNFALNFRSLLIVMAINLSYGFLVGGIDNASHVGGAIVGGLLGVVYVMQYRAIRQQQLFAHKANSVPWQPNTLANSEISGITSHQSTPPSSHALSGKIVRSSYMILTVLFIGIYWWLHTNFMQLLNTTLPSIIH
ncbi:rhomboid family intramembrane serine protease [Moraxella osloensis]|uniref:Rhomboid family intramembrane serine protease n=1 Tax=Faucicola osloensis TaxID=34062 RepID=A0A2D2LTE9_FAUOS|nr:rhomboid family intramembrane serine protease [Moraxella osloensis]ATR78308.1 rhomboid family intramembrane serine protease [Moraxella osloensis]